MLRRNLSSLGVETPLAPFIPTSPRSTVTVQPAILGNNQNVLSSRSLDDLTCSWPAWPRQSLETFGLARKLILRGVVGSTQQGVALHIRYRPERLGNQLID